MKQIDPFNYPSPLKTAWSLGRGMESPEVLRETLQLLAEIGITECQAMPLIQKSHKSFQRHVPLGP